MENKLIQQTAVVNNALNDLVKPLLISFGGDFVEGVSCRYYNGPSQTITVSAKLKGFEYDESICVFTKGVFGRLTINGFEQAITVFEYAKGELRINQGERNKIKLCLDLVDNYEEVVKKFESFLEIEEIKKLDEIRKEVNEQKAKQEREWLERMAEHLNTLNAGDKYVHQFTKTSRNVYEIRKITSKRVYTYCKNQSLNEDGSWKTYWYGSGQVIFTKQDWFDSVERNIFTKLEG